ncbi:MAG: heparinase II/III family protein, partial [Pyrinomonadaceae bacterium]
MKYYAMHSILPDGENVFDFADVGDGSLNRNGTSKRESLYGEYDILYRLASVYRDPEAQAIGDFILNDTKLGTREPMWAFINRDSDVMPASLSQIPLYHHFVDNDTIFWRSDWTRKATAFAFRCAPPEGHHAAKLASKISDWRQNTGHAHPDANSFIIWANGKYLTGDTGYLGIKQTDDHNTILINGRGQEAEGVYEMFKAVSNERLDRIRIAESWASPQFFYVRGEAASGYFADLGLRKFDRHFLYVAPDYFLVWDELATKEPSKFTFMLNADRVIRLAGNSADLINGEAALSVVRFSPAEAHSEVVPQIVQARGLPGSVDKGESEQRGTQLRTTNLSPTAKTEFLHLLQVKNLKTETPRISFGDQTGPFVSLVLANGDRDTVCLTSANCSSVSDARRLIVRHSKDKKVNRLMWQNATRINSGTVMVMESSRSVSGSIRLLQNGKLSGYISSETGAQLRLVLPIVPNKLFVNGVAVKFEKNGTLVSMLIAPGQNLVEIE